MVRLITLLLFVTALFGANCDWNKARELYQHTNYSASLDLLLSAESPDAKTWGLMGQNYYMLGDYKKATDAFQKASALAPASSEYVHWLGRTFGRRAETSNPFAAPMHASKARQNFEKAVELDPRDEEALNDLFDYYLQAPGFLGGGFEKAEAIAKRIAELNPAEGHFAQAQLAERRKQFDTAEEQLRRAMTLSPRQVGRVLDLAKYLAKRGRFQESDEVFKQADAMAPNSPKVMFATAHTFIQQNRNLEEAKNLLQKYLQSNLTPDDPSREEAEKLLKQIPTGA